MVDPFVEAYTNALRAMEGGAPKGLVRRAALEAEDIAPQPDVSEASLRAHLANCDPDDKLRMDLHLNLAKWDAAPAGEADWTLASAPNTDRRRAIVVDALRLDAQTATLLAERFPVAKQDETTVIAGEWEPWYTPEIQRSRAFYWGHYVEYLRSRRGWGAEAITSLDIATTHVVERLINPSRAKAGQTKGLVVGYVQSGKTANFTGVIAKAIDAGYRLIIVMTGTTNLLREQTQRRLDMELVGRENILRRVDETDPEALDQVDYLDDEDWIKGRFVSHGVRPSDIGRPDIHRMTTRRFDYRKLQQGLPALEFERRDRTKPLWHAENLFTSDARLIIVKKNSSVLRNLVKDLKNTADKLEHIPALIIDDESDQASVNTTSPKQWEAEKKKRTAINGHLSSLLQMLPRAQYVGYTATPFANVFVDPSDAEDIFPKDYLISLQRPADYMGADDFHDLDLAIPEAERTYANSKEKAHLRLLDEVDEEGELRSALDSFVLAGAIKLCRAEAGLDEFRHHTMLVHETARRAGQRTRSESIQELWRTGGYLSGRAYTRLQALFDSDFLPVSEALGLGYPVPQKFEELSPYLGAVTRKIAPNGNPVLVVNSDTDIEQEDLDFDKRSVWRVLVGGNKLARGFTVEGLTITYYSREVGHAEALMQMGRWFGFRPGYRDLVRLFITPKVRDSLEAACRDEAHFRDELRQYAMMADGRPTITPEDIPPLVARHGLRPTAANKMYNAQLIERRHPTKEPSSGYPSLDDQQDALDRNIDACVPLLQAVANNEMTLGGSRGKFDALVGTVTRDVMVNVLHKLTWATPETFAPDLNWIQSLSSEVLSDWIIMFPQQRSRERVKIADAGWFSVHGRTVGPGGRIRGNSASSHRAAIRDLIVGKPNTGGAIVYPVMNKDEVENAITIRDGRPQRLVMAFTLQLPESALPDDHRPLIYQVVVKNKPRYAIVDK